MCFNKNWLKCVDDLIALIVANKYYKGQSISYRLANQICVDFDSGTVYFENMSHSKLFD